MHFSKASHEHRLQPFIFLRGAQLEWSVTWLREEAWFSGLVWVLLSSFGLLVYFCLCCSCELLWGPMITGTYRLPVWGNMITICYQSQGCLWGRFCSKPAVSGWMAHWLDNLEWPYPGLCLGICLSVLPFWLRNLFLCAAAVGGIVWTGRVTSSSCSPSIVEIHDVFHVPFHQAPTSACVVVESFSL